MSNIDAITYDRNLRNEYTSLLEKYKNDLDEFDRLISQKKTEGKAEDQLIIKQAEALRDCLTSYKTIIEHDAFGKKLADAPVRSSILCHKNKTMQMVLPTIQISTTIMDRDPNRDFVRAKISNFNSTFFKQISDFEPLTAKLDAASPEISSPN
mgnify:FL=1